MSIHDQIRSRRAAKGWSQGELAAAVSQAQGAVKTLSWQTVQQWENGTSAPSRRRLPFVAEVLGCTVQELLEIEEDSNVEAANTRRSVPLISWVQAGAWDDELPKLQDDDPSRIDVFDTMTSDKAFALKVSGDSMTTPRANGHSFPPGTIIVVDPAVPAKAGDFVVAKDATTGEATFKKLTTDGGRWFLHPLNTSYPTVEIDDPAKRVIGRVVDSYFRQKL